MNNLNIDTSNAWVFISHSNKDFEKITLVRNKLESMHYRPLLFFLKCLDEDVEIFELIKREIQARDRFILCSSKNTSSSEWVQKEVEYIQSLHRPFDVIDIDSSEEDIDKAIKRFDLRSTVYVWSTDENLATHVSKELVDKAFKVGILPYDYLENYYLLKRGVNVDHFQPIDLGSYVTILINRILTEKEIYILDTVSDFFRASDHSSFLLFVVSNDETMQKKITLGNEELLRPMLQENGICARYITSEEVSDQTNQVVSQILKLDEYHFNLSINGEK